jgi:hypothetical protein
MQQSTYYLRCCFATPEVIRGPALAAAQPQRFICVSNLEKPVPDPKDPDLPPDIPSPEYAPGEAPQEFPAEPPATGDPDDGRPRASLGTIATREGEE